MTVLALLLAAHVAIPTAPVYAYGMGPICADVTRRVVQ